MSEPTAGMHPAYLETRFRVEEPVEDWPDEFVVVSAYATTGQTWTPEKNRKADRELAQVIAGESVWHRRITGFSPVTGHSEPSWAVGVPLEVGCLLGTRFEQDAVYHVLGDELSVVRCGDEMDRVLMGSFRARLEVTGA